MANPRAIAEVLAAVRVSVAEGTGLPTSICLACVANLPVDGAAVSLISKGSQRERVGASDEDAGWAEDLQITLGQGPAADAVELGLVLISDLAGAEARRWPAFASEVSTGRFRAIFVLPLQIGAVRLGTLSLYRRSPGSLEPEALSDALRVADVIAMFFLGNDGDLTDDFAEKWLDQSWWTREVHQATGVVIAQLGIGADEAFVRLRAYAFSHEMALKDVAAAVVERRLRLGDASG